MCIYNWIFVIVWNYPLLFRTKFRYTCFSGIITHLSQSNSVNQTLRWFDLDMYHVACFSSTLVRWCARKKDRWTSGRAYSICLNLLLRSSTMIIISFPCVSVGFRQIPESQAQRWLVRKHNFAMFHFNKEIIKFLICNWPITLLTWKLQR